MSSTKRKPKRKAASRVGVSAKPAVTTSEEAQVYTTKARVVKYRTHRGVYAAVIKEGSKWLSYVMVDDYPIKLYRHPVKPTVGRSELYYMDDYQEYPLVKAVKMMLFVGSIRGINENAKTFLNEILDELHVDVKTITSGDMYHG